MEVINEVYPTDPQQFEKMREAGPQGPIVMVNLLKFKEKAEYEDGRETDLSGREAYLLYARSVSKLVTEFGGRVLFVGDVTYLMLGKVEDLWDEVALAEYPNRVALVAMTSSEAFQKIAVHRKAGLEGQLNIETVYGAELQRAFWVE